MSAGAGVASDGVAAAVVALPVGGVKKSYHELIVQRRGALMTIQFNRPAVRNALRRRTIYELFRALDAASADPEVNVIVLMGNAEAFTAGNDLSDVAAVQNKGLDALNVYFRASNYVMSLLVKRMLLCRKVLVALVQGVCVGMGVTLCALCDVVYATETAQFWTPFSKLGLCAELGSSWTLPHLLGRSKAAELLLFGTRMDAQMALQHGFVVAVLQEDQLQVQFWQRMEEHARLPAASLLATKRLLQHQWRPNVLAAFSEECKELASLRRRSTYLGELAAFAGRAKRSQLKSKL
ncbi:enoyl-CoA delta isomerase 2, mitochondrial [Scaptodrosophila lebanonensis]|uniref:Enoyl-CoA delta isomerase 2, mitochondrial n=1 Tax=Drosophila lebanonensis TaxID=7225 RepID=A0A6J2TSX6_DROLE|nr:enoyl-CoA delta isomerase 2, mitochondrial [Scaptodrosophila lebanonensis]